MEEPIRCAASASSAGADVSRPLRLRLPLERVLPWARVFVLDRLEREEDLESLAPTHAVDFDLEEPLEEGLGAKHTIHLIEVEGLSSPHSLHVHVLDETERSDGSSMEWSPERERERERDGGWKEEK